MLPLTVSNMQAVTADLETEGGKEAPTHDDWKPTHREWGIMISLAFLSTMVALDATILVTVLPVGFLWKFCAASLLTRI